MIPQPYTIIHPKLPQSAVIFNSPHSGIFLPDEFLNLTSLTPAHLLYSGDILVDRLIGDTPRFGATALCNIFARTYVDTNRAAHEIDRDMFLNYPKSGPAEKTANVTRGFGIITRRSYDGQEIYGKKLPASEIEKRLEHIYHPVHNVLRQIFNKRHEDHGFYILIDCHSMPSYEFINANASNTKQPDLIIGNRFNSSCSEKLTGKMANFFSGNGLKVAFNVPYAGGFNTQTYGQPHDQRHAIQLEFNRAIYMDERTFEPHEGFAHLQALLTGLSRELVNFSP